MELARPILFVELRFLWIFLAIFGVHWALRSNRARKLWLLVASHAFYGCFFIGNPLEFFPKLFAGSFHELHVGWWFPALLWFSTVLDYRVGLGIEGARSDRARRTWLGASLAVNLGVLGFFKYYGFFAQNVVALLAWLGLEPSSEPLRIFLPYGISFYTFQTLSYTIDVYRRRLPAERSFLDFAFFIAFFPQLIAGPIVRAMTFLPQLASRGVSRTSTCAAASRCSSSASSRRPASPTTSRAGGSRLRAPAGTTASAPGRRWSATRCRSTATSPATPTWRSRPRACSATSSGRTSTSPTCRAASPSSGAAGTSASPRGCATTSTSLWAAIGAAPWQPTVISC